MSVTFAVLGLTIVKAAIHIFGIVCGVLIGLWLWERYHEVLRPRDRS
jgi:hypothetical protein